MNAASDSTVVEFDLHSFIEAGRVVGSLASVEGFQILRPTNGQAASDKTTAFVSGYTMTIVVTLTQMSNLFNATIPFCKDRIKAYKARKSLGKRGLFGAVLMRNHRISLLILFWNARDAKALASWLVAAAIGKTRLLRAERPLILCFD